MKKQNKKLNTLTDEAPEIDSSFLQHEIDHIVETAKPEETVEEIKQEVIQKLREELPSTEKVSAQINPKRNHDVEIIVRNTSHTGSHSPYVLDLSEMIAKKRREEEKKQKVRTFLSPPKTSRKIILAESKTPVMITAPKKEKIKPLKIKIKPEKLVTKFQLPSRWHRSVLAYSLLCLLLVIPIKGFSYYQNLQESQAQIVEYATSAYQDLKVASGALSDNHFNTADEQFGKAKNNFTDAEKELNKLNIVLKTILKVIPTDGANVADAEYLLDTGKQLSRLGQELTGAITAFSSKKEAPLVDKISYFQDNLKKIIPKLTLINNNLQKTRPEAIPEDKQEAFQTIKTYVSALTNDIKELSSLSDSLYEILGRDNQRRYLFVFQNNNEMRPTGGFIGSFALVDIDRGEIKRIEIPGGGSYSVQGQLSEKVVAPYPLHLVNARWEMQDANWFPDFPTSAQKIKWFYEKSGGPTVDGVIAMNASLIPKLLEITEPIDLPAYGKTLSASNFIEETQKAVEFEYDKTKNKPKQILADLAPELLKKIFDAQGEDLLKIVKVFKSGLDEKNIQLYFENEGAQEKFASYNWTGQMKDSSKDFLAIVNTNIRGYKTDAYIKQDISLVSDIADNGEITNTLTITREHTGSWKKTFDRQSNINFLRVYVPSGSKLLSAQGFSELPKSAFEPADPDWKTDTFLEKIQGKIWVEPDSNTFVNNEFNKTVFGNWIQTDPGEKQTIVISYKLPFTLTKNPDKQWFEFFKNKTSKPFYSLFLQKQSGTENANYNITINLPSNHQFAWLYPAKINQTEKTIKYQTNLSKDELMAFLLN
jgi:hypothetical protein